MSGRSNCLTNSRSMRFCSAPKSIRVWRELETWLKRRVTGSGRQGLEVIDEPSTCIPEITGWVIFWPKKECSKKMIWIPIIETFTGIKAPLSFLLSEPRSPDLHRFGWRIRRRERWMVELMVDVFSRDGKMDTGKDWNIVL